MPRADRVMSELERVPLMKLYELDLKDRFAGWVQGTPKWYTPPILCPKCGWASCPALTLPCVDIGKTPLPGKPVTPAQFEEVVKVLTPYYPPGFPVQQQQCIGQTTAETRGKPGLATVLIGAGISCFDKDAFAELLARGIHPIQNIPIRLPKKSKYAGQYVQVQASALVTMSRHFHPTGDLRVCGTCGQMNLHKRDPERIAIVRSSIPHSGDFFAIKEWGELLVVTERFRGAAAGLFPELTFRELPLHDE
jgi:hypothetical protein